MKEWKSSGIKVVRPWSNMWSCSRSFSEWRRLFNMESKERAISFGSSLYAKSALLARVAVRQTRQRPFSPRAGIAPIERIEGQEKRAGRASDRPFFYWPGVRDYFFTGAFGASLESSLGGFLVRGAPFDGAPMFMSGAPASGFAAGLAPTPAFSSTSARRA
jgi:hypothetical protein